MPLNISELLRCNSGRNYDLHRAHVNPRFASVLKTIGYDRCYVRAEGQYLWDATGQKYLDMLGGYAVFNLGRNHPVIRQALIDFMQLDYPSLVQMEAPLLSGLLAEELKKRINRVGRQLDIVYFTNSGAEGVETAIKFARCATGKHVIVHCNKAFHGLTNGALALNGDASFRDGFEPFLPESRAIPFNDLEALDEALSKGDVSAFIVEPIQGKGVHVPSPGYLADACRLCRKHGALFIVDEVQTGVGRTGRFLAIDHESGQQGQAAPGGQPAAPVNDAPLDPDIIILSKALSGGFVPVGAVLTRKWIYDKVFSSLDRAVVHSSTFGQGSLAMVAGLASLSVLDDENLCANAEHIGGLIREGVEAMMHRFEFIREVRQRGLMIGIQFHKPRSLGLRTAWAVIHGMDANLFPQAVTMPLLDNHHILTQVAGHRTNCVKLIPPLTLNEEDVGHFLRAFEAVMTDLHKFPGPVWSVLKKLGKHAVTQRSSQLQAANE